MTIYFDGEIMPDTVIPFIERCEIARESQDSLKIYFASSGGLNHSGRIMSDYISTYPFEKTMIACGPILSAAAYIFCNSVANKEILGYANMMFHESDIEGSIRELKDGESSSMLSKTILDMCNDLTLPCLKKVLTNAELKRIASGKDVWIHDKQRILAIAQKLKGMPW